nr:uncharacterized protein LOC109187072 [Ipomoea batatas]
MKTEKCYNITFNSRGESDVTTATDWDTSRHTTIKDKMIFITESGKDTSVWYFDSGCSRHMTGNPNNLENIHYKSEGHVTFGDGEKGQIIASGTLNVHALPRLPKVFLIQGLKANLISISQLCEDELKVEFSKEDCKVYNQGHEYVMIGKRSSAKCYTWDRRKELTKEFQNWTLMKNRKCDACLEIKMTRTALISSSVSDERATTAEIDPSLSLVLAARAAVMAVTRTSKQRQRQNRAVASFPVAPGVIASIHRCGSLLHSLLERSTATAEQSSGVQVAEHPGGPDTPVTFFRSTKRQLQRRG